jgi:hypothetical protein
LSLFHGKLLGGNIEPLLLQRSTNPSLSAMTVVLSNNVENNLLGLLTDIWCTVPSIIGFDEEPSCARRALG